jgi:hypothetical protein
MSDAAASAGDTGNVSAQTDAAGAWSMRVKLHQISLSRSDGAEEDDFKTWAHVQLVTRGAANSALWYGSLDGLKQNLAFTSSSKPNITIIGAQSQLYWITS